MFSVRSIRARLALRHAAMLALVVLAIEVASYFAVAQLLAQRGDRLLESASSALVRDLLTELDRGKPVADAIETSTHDVRFRDVTMTVRPLAIAAPSVNDSARFVTRSAVDDVGDTRIREEVVSTSRARLQISASRSLFEDHETLEAVQRAYVIAAALAILLSAFVTWRLASAALAPIETLTTRAATLGSGDLHQRLPVISPHDEFGRLTTVLNGMLERIDASFSQQRQFVADASHELRTPIAVLRTELDVTQANPERSSSEYRETLVRLDRVTARLERLVADLFLLARADAGGLPVPHQPLDVTMLARNTVALIQGIAEERGVEFTLDADARRPTLVLGNEQHLERALLNLLDNALRFAPRASAITVRVARTATQVVVDVADCGPGIDPTLVQALFDRFRRTVPSAADRPHDGAGLGLSIAQALVKLHHGQLLLHSTDANGSTFRIELPLAPTDVA